MFAAMPVIRHLARCSRGGVAWSATGKSLSPHLRALHTTTLHALQTTSEGELGTTDWRMHFEDSTGKMVSPWHDIELRAPTPAGAAAGALFVNFVVEIPARATAKMEISGELPHNPIVQDTNKDGTPRDYHFESMVNYGALPQTWEDPEHTDEDTGMLGDGDPVDVCDISSIPCQIGDVYPVRVLGILGMIDEGEMDWKVVAINAADPLALTLPGLTDPDFPADLRKHVDAVQEWFETYKIPDGKPRNVFAFDGQPQSAEYAAKVIDTTHGMWKALCDAGGNGKMWVA